MTTLKFCSQDSNFLFRRRFFVVSRKKHARLFKYLGLKENFFSTKKVFLNECTRAKFCPIVLLHSSKHPLWAAHFRDFENNLFKIKNKNFRPKSSLPPKKLYQFGGGGEISTFHSDALLSTTAEQKIKQFFNKITKISANFRFSKGLRGLKKLPINWKKFTKIISFSHVNWFFTLEASDAFELLLEAWSFLSGERPAFRLYRLTEEKRLAVLDGLEFDSIWNEFKKGFRGQFNVKIKNEFF